MLAITVKIILFTLFYSIHYFVISTIFGIMSLPVTKIVYFLPVFIMITLSFSTQVSYKISHKLYSFIYYVSTSYLGLLLNMFMFNLLYHLLAKLLPISPSGGMHIAVIFPSIISVYGLINARIIKIDKQLINANSPTKLTIAHLSDTHFGAIYQKRFAKKIVNIINNQIKPDIVVITGDFFDNNLEPEYEWISSFNEIAVPMLYVTGNHEDMIGKSKVLNIVKKCNMIVLGSSSQPYEFKGYNFVGNDYDSDIFRKLSSIKTKNNIILNHIPAISQKEIEKYNVFLFLCGHTHAGQMFPIHIFDYMINKCFKGIYENKGKFVYVNHGSGTSLFPMRIGSSSCIGALTIS